MEKELTHQLKKDLVSKFVFGGKSIFTVRNENTGNRFTYRVRKLKTDDVTKDIYFVSVLVGSDNEHSYKFFGTIFNKTTYKFSINKSKVSQDAQSVKVFEWLLKKISTNTLPDFVKIYHEGKCGRCGRTLTVPESIENGIGPECMNYV